MPSRTDLPARATIRRALALFVLPLLAACAGGTRTSRSAAAAPAVTPCGSGLTAIPSIQGTGLASPLAGRTVSTWGVVVGDFEGPAPALRGFYLQDPNGDGDPATSDGLFVANGDADSVALGDVVRVTGTVEEADGQTQLWAVTALTRCARGATVAPVDLTLPFAAPDALEPLEGMLVRLPQTLTVTEHFQLGRFGQVVLSFGGRLWQPTQRHAPGPDAEALAAVNRRNRLIVDDAHNGQNADPIVFGRGGAPLSAANPLRGGDEVTGLVGVLTQTWGGHASSGVAYRVRPLQALGGGMPVFSPANTRAAAPAAVGGTLRVSAFNVLNYFNTFGSRACALGEGGAQADCRGAATASDFERQAAKIVAAIVALDADILGIMEIENDGYAAGSAIADLVRRLDAATAPGTYAYVDADARTGTRNALGTDAIKVGLLYKPARVSLAGRTAVLATTAFVNGGDEQPRTRPSLVQAFAQADGEVLVVSVNHFKSKSGGCDVPDARDLQGNCNAVRTAAARELAAFLATDPTGTGDPDVLLLGDLNAYAMEDPVTTLLARGFVNLESARHADSYSYGFDGQWGSLDHALASASLAAQVTGVTTWHINADEPSVLDYQTGFKSAAQRATLYAPDPLRSSDHDPVLVGIRLGRSATP